MKLFTTAIAALSTALVMGTSALAMFTTNDGYSPRELDQGEISTQTYGAKTVRDTGTTFHDRYSDRPTRGGNQFQVTRFSFMATPAQVVDEGFGPDAR